VSRDRIDFFQGFDFGRGKAESITDIYVDGVRVPKEYYELLNEDNKMKIVFKGALFGRKFTLKMLKDLLKPKK
jgi:hypothetical protein